jgi:hypothetical protein
MSRAERLPRAQTIAAGVGVLVLVLVAASVGWVGTSVLGALDTEAVTKADILETLRRRPLPTRAADGGVAIPAETARLAGETEAVAANGLQEIATRAVEDAGGEIGSAEVVRIVDGIEATRRIVVSVAFEADIAAVQQALFSLETGVPFVVVDALALLPSEASGRVDEGLLRASLVVSGFWKPPAAATAESVAPAATAGGGT